MRPGHFWTHVHGWITAGWAFQFPLVFWLAPSLQRSLPYLIGISIAAALLGQMAAWQAARVEYKMEKGGEKIDN